MLQILSFYSRVIFFYSIFVLLGFVKPSVNKQVHCDSGKHN